MSRTHPEPGSLAMRSRLGVLTALAVLVAAGCGDDDGSDATGTSTSTSTSSVETTSSSSAPTSSTSTSTSPSTGSPDGGCTEGDASIPKGAATDEIEDVDGDGAADTGWIARVGDEVVVGIAASAGGGARRQFDSASPVRRSVLVVDADQRGPVELLADDGRSVRLWQFVACDIVEVESAPGDPYVFSLGFAEVGTGVGCVGIDGRRHLVGLDVVDAGDDTVEWSRTVVELDDGRARHGATTTGTFHRPEDDHAIDLLHEVTCGDATMEDDGVTLPR